MKAAVLYQFGALPQYEDFPAPTPQHPDDVRVHLSAAAIKNLDRARADGTHYARHRLLPAVVGTDGVGVLDDGTRVYADFDGGSLAELAFAPRHRCVPLPTNVDDVTAAALPNPGLSAWFSLAYRAALQPGETVLILGATGVTGKLAIQLAKYLGAGHVVATGRNPEALAALPVLGADTVISMQQPEADFMQALRQVAAQHPFDVVIDYLWGRPAEQVLALLSGHDLHAVPQRTRYVQVGDMAGATITLPAGILRSAAIELYGIGGGSIPREILRTVPSEILPRLFQLAGEGRLRIGTEAVPLPDVANAWERGDTDGKRLVVVL